MRRSGIDVVRDRPSGTHFCNFYDSRKDLLDMLVSYFKAGLEDNEFCVWVVSEPLSEREAWNGLRAAVSDFDDYVSRRSIEVFDGRDRYLKGGAFDSNRVMTAWNEKLDRALDCGYAGLRGSGTPLGYRRRTGELFRNTNS
jgi:MEDS: MEthanogen/methylotroph, DcmR Sensory domain